MITSLITGILVIHPAAWGGSTRKPAQTMPTIDHSLIITITATLYQILKNSDYLTRYAYERSGVHDILRGILPIEATLEDEHQDIRHEIDHPFDIPTVIGTEPLIDHDSDNEDIDNLLNELLIDNPNTPIYNRLYEDQDHDYFQLLENIFEARLPTQTRIERSRCIRYLCHSLNQNYPINLSDRHAAVSNLLNGYRYSEQVRQLVGLDVLLFVAFNEPGSRNFITQQLDEHHQKILQRYTRLIREYHQLLRARGEDIQYPLFIDERLDTFFIQIINEFSQNALFHGICEAYIAIQLYQPDFNFSEELLEAIELSKLFQQNHRIDASRPSESEDLNRQAIYVGTYNNQPVDSEQKIVNLISDFLTDIPQSADTIPTFISILEAIQNGEREHLFRSEEIKSLRIDICKNKKKMRKTVYYARIEDKIRIFFIHQGNQFLLIDAIYKTDDAIPEATKGLIKTRLEQIN